MDRPIKTATVALCCRRLLAIAIVLILSLLAAVSSVQAALAKVTAIMMRETVGELQVVVLTSGPVAYRLQRVRADWIVLDVLGAELGTLTGPIPPARGLVKRIRMGQFAA